MPHLANKKIRCTCGVKFRMPMTGDGQAFLLERAPEGAPVAPAPSSEFKAPERPPSTIIKPASAFPPPRPILPPTPAPSIPNPNDIPDPNEIALDLDEPANPPKPPAPEHDIALSDEIDLSVPLETDTLDLSIDPIEPVASAPPTPAPVARTAPPAPPKPKAVVRKGPYRGVTFAIPKVAPVVQEEPEIEATGEPTEETQEEEPSATSGPACPSCGRVLAENSQICAACGIYIKSGRPLITVKSEEQSDTYQENAVALVKIASYFAWIGIYPVDSSHDGHRRPVALWTLVGFTVFCSVIYFYISVNPKHSWTKNLMLWSGDKEMSASRIDLLYTANHWGNYKVYEKKRDKIYEALKAEEDAKEDRIDKKIDDARAAKGLPARSEMDKLIQREKRIQKARKKAADESDDSDDSDEDSSPLEKLFGLKDPLYEQAVIQANDEMPPDERSYGEFHWYQLITHALLHGGWEHLLGNLVFMIAYGKAVNARIGSVGTFLIYPILAVVSGIIAWYMQSDGLPTPSLGASGAIMGLAGMYLVLYPIHPMQNVAWIRYFFGFNHCFPFFFTCRGFWLILIGISLDILRTLSGAHDGVGHWSHIGGFFTGVTIATILIVSRGINPQGSDVYSLIFGKLIWPIVGKPSQWQQGVKEGWLQRFDPVGSFVKAADERKKAKLAA
jgi:membrane associated rhomboid family serine protease